MKSTIPLSVIALLVLTGCAPKSITHQVSSIKYQARNTYLRKKEQLILPIWETQ